MERSGPRKCVLVLVGLLSMVSQGRAQDWLHLDPVKWETVIEFEGVRERIKDAQSSDDAEVEMGVSLRQGGFVLDPRIAAFSLEANPVVSRGRFRSTNRDENRDGEFLNFNLQLDILEGAPTPVSANLQATRNTGTTEASLGSRTSFRTENRYLSLNWENRPFPSTIDYSERILDQTFQSGLTSATSRRDEIVRTLAYRGRSRKMQFNVERTWFDDRVGTTDRDYTTDRVLLQNFFRWGKGSRLNSRLEFFQRDGFRSYDKIGVDETVFLRHTPNLSSSYAYRFSSLTQDRETLQHTGLVTVTHELFDNLTTTVNAEARSTDIEVSQEEEYEARLDFAYRKGIFWGGKLRAGLGGGYGVTDRVSQGGLLEVIDESHVVDATRLVVLDRRFIDTTTIVVTDAAGALVFTEGSDYTVLPAGNDLTELQIVPAGQINVGDTILVSYKFDALPSAGFTSIPYQFRTDVDFGWISLFYRLTGENETLTSGADQNAVNDRLQTTTGLELRWIRPELNATFAAEMRSFEFGDFESDSIDFRQSVLYSLAPNAALNLNASQNFVESDGTQTDLYNVDLSLRWLPWRNLSVSPHVGAWMRKEKGISDERFVTGGLDVRYSLGLIDVHLKYTHERRRGTITDRDEDRLMLTLVRHFQ